MLEELTKEIATSYKAGGVPNRGVNQLASLRQAWMLQGALLMQREAILTTVCGDLNNSRDFEQIIAEEICQIDPDAIILKYLQETYGAGET